MRKLVRLFVPRRLRRSIQGLLRDAAGVTSLEARIDRLETRLYESREEMWERSRRRWRGAAPDDSRLTWGVEIRGDNFIQKAAFYHVLGPDKTILEIGPGYGRLLRAVQEHNIPFKKYLGVDISQEIVRYLKEKFSSPDIDFVNGDTESISLSGNFDALISSLTFEQLFPSFEAALWNLVKHLNPGAMVCFDLVEGKRMYFEDDTDIYCRFYTRPEVQEMLGKASLELVAFDEVEHTPKHKRLLVVARKPL